MRKKVILLAILSQIFTFYAMAPALANELDDSDFCSTDIEKKIEKKAGDYDIRISYGHDRICQRLEILKHTKAVFREGGADMHYSLGSEWNGYRKPYLMNMIGHGTHLFISKWTGATHCCMSLLIFDLDNEFRKVAEIEGGNSDPEIVDINHDGIPEIRIADDFLAYRFSSFGTSALGTVILKYSNGKYVLAEEMMKHAPPPQSSWKKRIPGWRKALRGHDPDWPPESFIQALTDLVFTGNSDRASQFVDQVWPEDLPGKNGFLKAYKEALSESRYYSKSAAHFIVR